MSMAQFWFNFNNAWSGQKYYTEGSIQFYNLMYTSLPILLLGEYYFYSMVVCKYVSCAFVDVNVNGLTGSHPLRSLQCYYMLGVAYCPTQDMTERSRCHPTCSGFSPYPPSTDTFTQPHLHFIPSFQHLFSTSSIPHVSHSYTSSLTSTLPLLYIFSYLFSTSFLPLLFIFTYLFSTSSLPY